MAWYIADRGGRAAQVVVCWVWLRGLHVLLILLSRRITTLPGIPAGARRFWWTLTVTGSIYLLGDLVQLVAIARAPHAQNSATGVPLQTVAVDAGTLLLVGGMLTSPLGLTTARQRARFWLDAATVMAAATAFGFYITVVPGDGLNSRGDLLGGLHAVLLGPVLMLVGLFAVVKLLLSGCPPFTRQAGLLAASAAGVEGFAQGIQTQVLAANDEMYWLFATTVLANALLTAAAMVQRHQVTADPQMLSRPHRRHYSLLPYGAIATTYVLLVLTLYQTGLDVRAWMVLTAAIASTALVVVRQVAAFTENARLLAELDAKVRERDELAAALHHQAFHDSLTGLANRALFTDRLEAALARARRSGGTSAVMVIDLDDFKPVNDRLGHSAGDELLTEVATRLNQSVRETDLVARLGGDEFGVLLEQPLTESIAAVAGRIVSAMAPPIEVAGGPVAVSASVGAAVDRGGQRCADTLLNDADIAMYVAKSHGKGRFQISGQHHPGRHVEASLGPDR